MIKLNPDPTFQAIVKLSIPGAADTVEINMTFRHMASDKVASWFKENVDVRSSEALDKVIVDWTGVMGDDGQMVPYSKEALDTLLKNYRPATTEIIAAWQREMNESRLKN
jgi:hypothetical protein